MALLDTLKNTPEAIAFADVIAHIDNHYDYSPTRFTNGDAVNEAGTNEGSCKIFAFAQLQSLSVDATLALFGHYYHEDVLMHPDADDHANIRNFMKRGWQGVQFDGQALTARASETA